MTQQAMPIITDLGKRSAVISPCGTYRYALERSTGIQGPNVTWLMLNPSTADASKDDPTIRKVVGFSKRNGFGVAMVVNLFAWRATDPKECLANLADAEGHFNFKAVTEAAAISDVVICAWGRQPWAKEQAANVLGWIPDTGLFCLGTNGDGSPRHPLMQPYVQRIVPFDARAYLGSARGQSTPEKPDV